MRAGEVTRLTSARLERIVLLSEFAQMPREEHMDELEHTRYRSILK